MDQFDSKAIPGVILSFMLDMLVGSGLLPRLDCLHEVGVVVILVLKTKGALHDVIPVRSCGIMSAISVQLARYLTSLAHQSARRSRLYSP